MGGLDLADFGVKLGCGVAWFFIELVEVLNLAGVLAFDCDSGLEGDFAGNSLESIKFGAKIEREVYLDHADGERCWVLGGYDIFGDV